MLGTASLWLLLSRWVLLEAGGFYLTVAWGFLALLMFNAGLLLRERVYRWAGLALLGLALGRVIVFDVWKLETIYRIFSFMGLGIVLLVLGFIYNRYQEKIRRVAVNHFPFVRVQLDANPFLRASISTDEDESFWIGRASCGLILLAWGCVNTVDGRKEVGVPFIKDQVQGRYPRQSRSSGSLERRSGIQWDVA